VTNADRAYNERARLVVLLAQMARVVGWKAGRYWDGSQEPGWNNVVAIDLPTGQVSWHIGAEDCGDSGIAMLPSYDGKWDEHTTPQKWDRVQQMARTIAKALQESP
jgi:hypothetical protein